MRPLALLLLPLAACGPDPDCVTPTLGLRVFDVETATCRDYEDQASAFVRTFTALGRIDPRFSDAEDTVRGYAVHARQENWGCSEKGCFAGMTYCPIRDIDVNEEFIPTHGILIHELVHAAQGCMAWVLEAGDAYPGTDRVEYGHESWDEHQVFEYIDHATESMRKAKEARVHE